MTLTKEQKVSYLDMKCASYGACKECPVRKDEYANTLCDLSYVDNDFVGLTEEQIDYMIAIFDGKNTPKIEWRKDEMQNDKVKKHEKICKGLTDLYAKKNSDYGDSFGESFQEFGLTMSAIRLQDKLKRFKSLIKNDALVKDEKIEDTLADLANYAIMTLIELAEKEQ